MNAAFAKPPRIRKRMLCKTKLRLRSYVYEVTFVCEALQDSQTYAVQNEVTFTNPWRLRKRNSPTRGSKPLLHFAVGVVPPFSLLHSVAVFRIFFAHSQARSGIPPNCGRGGSRSNRLMTHTTRPGQQCNKIAEDLTNYRP